MNFRFKCQCGAILSSSQEYVGQQIICTECDRRLIVPDAAPKPSAQKSQPARTPAAPSAPVAPAAQPLAPRQSALPKTGFQKKTAGGNSTVTTAVGIGLCVVALIGATVLGLMSKKSGNSRTTTVAKAEAPQPEAKAEPEKEPILLKPSKTFDPSSFAKNESKPVAKKPVVKPPRSSSPRVKPPTTNTPSKKPANRISPRSNPPRNTTQDDPAPGGKSFSIPASITPPETDYNTQELTKFIDPRFVRLDVKSREGESIGSGFFVTDTGVAVTNYHVVQGARSISVTTVDNKKSKLQGFYYVNPLKDLAVIQINPDEHDFQPLALSETLPQKGERVAAFGSPLGFSFSSSDGLVSSIRSGREIEKSLKDLAGIDVYKHLGFSVTTNWIQTTASISGGNSGGPLVNMRGQLVGVNTWTTPHGQNLNFASTVDEVRQVMQKASTQSLKPLSRLPSTVVYSRPPSRGGIAGGPRLRPGSPGFGNRPPTISPEERAAMEERRHGSESIVESTSKSAFKSSSGNAVREYSTDSRVVDMEISKDRKHLSAVTKEGELLVFDLSKGGMLLYSIASEHKLLRQARFSDKPSKMFTICDSGGQSSVIMRDIKTGEPEERQVGLATRRDLDASQMAISSDGRSVFATWVNDQSSGNSSLEEAKFWRFDVLENKSTGWNLERTFGRGTRQPTSAIFSPDNRHLITAFNDGYIVASTGAGNQLGTSGSHMVHSGKIFDIAITSDGKKIVSGGEDGYLGITAGWKNRKWRPTPLGQPGTEVMSVAVSSDDKLIAASRADNRIEIWSIETKGLLSTIESDSICTDIEFMGKDRFIIAAESEGGVKIYKVSVQK